MSEMKANEYLAALGEQGYYVTVDGSDSASLSVTVWPEPTDGRHTDELEEKAHYSNDPIAVGTGSNYVEALADAYRKVN